jgi:hypothetical protein
MNKTFRQPEEAKDAVVKKRRSDCKGLPGVIEDLGGAAVAIKGADFVLNCASKVKKGDERYQKNVGRLLETVSLANLSSN